METLFGQWPATREKLVEVQEALAREAPAPWTLPTGRVTVGGVFVCFGRGGSGPGAPGDRGWAASALVREGALVATVVVEGEAGAAYEAGLLALREGPLLERAVRALDTLPDVLLVNATGRDHPRRAGLALHLGAVLGVPTVGVTHRPLLAAGEWPGPATGDLTPLSIAGETVGYWVRTRSGARPLAVDAAWRTTAGVAVATVLACMGPGRTPEPLRQARRVARESRVRATAG